MTATMELLERAEPSLPVENMSGHTKKLRFLMDQLRVQNNRVGSPVSVLDFGCGNGNAVSRFLISDGVRYHGVDIHESSRSFADRNFGSENARFLPAVPRTCVSTSWSTPTCSNISTTPWRCCANTVDRSPTTGLLNGCVPNGYGPFENEKRLDHWFKISAFLDPRPPRRSVWRPCPTTRSRGSSSSTRAGV